MKKPKKPLIRFREVFPDPDMIGQSEYRAIHDAVVDGAFDGQVPLRYLTPSEEKLIKSMLEEFIGWAGQLNQKLGGKSNG